MEYSDYFVIDTLKYPLMCNTAIIDIIIIIYIFLVATFEKLFRLLLARVFLRNVTIMSFGVDHKMSGGNIKRMRTS